MSIKSRWLTGRVWDGAGGDGPKATGSVRLIMMMSSLMNWQEEISLATSLCDKHQDIGKENKGDKRVQFEYNRVEMQHFHKDCVYLFFFDAIFYINFTQFQKETFLLHYNNQTTSLTHKLIVHTKHMRFKKIYVVSRVKLQNCLQLTWLVNLSINGNVIHPLVLESFHHPFSGRMFQGLSFTKKLMRTCCFP